MLVSCCRLQFLNPLLRNFTQSFHQSFWLNKMLQKVPSNKLETKLTNAILVKILPSIRLRAFLNKNYFPMSSQYIKTFKRRRKSLFFWHRIAFHVEFSIGDYQHFFNEGNLNWLWDSVRWGWGLSKHKRLNQLWALLEKHHQNVSSWSWRLCRKIQ